jgi:VanZ family protein
MLPQASTGRNVDRLRAQRWILAGYLVGVSALMLTPIQGPSAAPDQMDKVVHAILIGVLAVLVWRVVPSLRWWRAFVSLAGALAFAGAIELAQGATRYRSPDVYDVVASGLGAVLAVGIALAVEGRRHRRQ